MILENLELSNGFLLQTRTEAETNLFGDSGAALLVAEWSCVTAVDCVFSNNRAVRSPPSLFSHQSVRARHQKKYSPPCGYLRPCCVETGGGLARTNAK